jgi:hypothetical protein
MLLAILIWIFCGIGAAFVAQSRGASGCLWFGLGMLFGPFGLAFAFAAGTDRKCPHCHERIHPEAMRCPKCQADLACSPSATSAHVPDPATKKCPDCAEDVRAEARKCRFCGFVFPAPPPAPEPAQADAAASASTTTPEQLQPPAPEVVSAPQSDEETRLASTNRPMYTLGIAFLILLAVYGTAFWLFRRQHQVERPLGRMENEILIYSIGCLTPEESLRYRLAGEKPLNGSIELRHGSRVIGPLEVTVIKHDSGVSSDYEYARVEVPGKGERWVPLDHLAK